MFYRNISLGFSFAGLLGSFQKMIQEKKKKSVHQNKGEDFKASNHLDSGFQEFILKVYPLKR